MLESLAAIGVMALQAGVVAALLGLLYRARPRMGLLPLVAAVGTLQYLHVVLLRSVYVEIVPGVEVSPGSAILFTATIFAILVVHVSEDAERTRDFVYGVALAYLAAMVLSALFGLTLTSSSVRNPLGVPAELLMGDLVSRTLRWVAFLVEAACAIAVYEALRVLAGRPFARLLLAALAALLLDEAIFTGVSRALDTPVDPLRVALDVAAGTGVAAGYAWMAERFIPAVSARAGVAVTHVAAGGGEKVSTEVDGAAEDGIASIPLARTPVGNRATARGGLATANGAGEVGSGASLDPAQAHRLGVSTAAGPSPPSRRSISLRDLLRLLTLREVYDPGRGVEQRDPLTGLLHRGFFDAALPLEIVRAQRTDTPLSLLIVDIDHFKSINDRYGHATGDRVLREVAAALREGVRGGDAACRIGGEELAVIAPHAGSGAALQLAQRIRGRIEARLGTAVSGAALERVTVTIGAATAPADATSAEDLFRVADERLYEGKRAGRDRVIGATPARDRV
ncbi:MAG TPA: GGDEF domain-containing protein [Thermoanaerobaculia bacterium]|nr:GGDEF domain-containing protein [Thermoanaerobaculia bacterium]